MDYFAAVRTFVRAAELGSFTQVALELSIKTSTASRHISELEADLRIALFNRSTRGLSLTEGGKVFYARASQVLLELDEAKAAASSLNLSPSGVLRVTLPVSFGRRHVMPYIAEFMRRYPDIDVEAVFSDDTLNLIEARIDVGIRIGTLTDSSLMARRLAGQRRVACATSDYLEKHGRPDSLAALTQHQCLVFSRTLGEYWYGAKAGGKATRDMHAGDVAAGSRRRGQAPVLADDTTAWQKVLIGGRFTANDSDALFEATLGGLGIALLPTWLAYAPLQAGRLENVLPEWDIRFAPEAPSIWAVYPRKKTVSSKVRSFIDFIAEKIGDPPYWEQTAPPARKKPQR